jgi:CheY-like chemotaxis protein
MSVDLERRVIVVVDDDHNHKATLESNLTDFEVRLWGCRKKCKICRADQPFAEAVEFIRAVSARPKSRLVAIVLDANEYKHDEYSIKEILPALKSDLELADIPVVVYSAKYLPGLGGRAMRAGAVAYYDRATRNGKEAAEIIRNHALR